jgi:epoxyqueuosine reductase
MVTARTLSENLKRKAAELGCARAGIARARELTDVRVNLSSWIGRGYAGDMGYMARTLEKRLNPDLVLPGVRSIIVTAWNYYSTARENETDRGKISRYAWSDDYHEILIARMKELEAFLAAEAPDSRSRCYVDAGPVHEKEWAVLAGIGWRGKHTNIVTRDAGSWHFLAVLLTTAVLEYDSPISDFCESCTRCIDACPTRAIVAPYLLDASRCISYLTIECRVADTPGIVEPDFKGWIFGCDICQEVCPWNRFAKRSADPGFRVIEGRQSVEPEEILEMDEQTFDRRFAKSPVLRAGLKGMKRNAQWLLSQHS